MNNYYLKELSNLRVDEFDIEFLLDLANRYESSAESVQGKNPDGSLRPVFHNYKNFYLKNSSRDYSNHPIFQKISKMCRRIDRYSDKEYIYSRSHIAIVPGRLPYHIDARGCVLTIPFEQIVHPISWACDNGYVLCSYAYSMPVLINTKIRHGCPMNDRVRRMFQVGFDQSFEEIADLLLSA